MEIAITVMDELVPVLDQTAAAKGVPIGLFIGRLIEQSIFFSVANADELSALVRGLLSPEEEAALIKKFSEYVRRKMEEK